MKVEWYREAWGDEAFRAAPPCPKTPDGRHVLALTGTWCTECGLRGRVLVPAKTEQARMAKNKTLGDDYRVGAVKTRAQVKNPLTGTWTKRDDKSGLFLDVKADPKPFKGVRKEKAR